MLVQTALVARRFHRKHKAGKSLPADHPNPFPAENSLLYILSTKEHFSVMVNITDTAVNKVREILEAQDPKPAGLRISVVGGGCSGFSYSMAFENSPNMLDKTYSYDGLKVFVDQASLLYLDGAEVDYVETLEGSGFKFNNPQVKSTCGCGSSFSV
jgi:iron-sulfur cluster assembly accessory protein